MVFSSELFVFAFLPAFLLAYYCVPRGWRNTQALIGSLLFYAFGAPKFVFVLVASTALDFWISHRVARAGAGRARGWLSLSLIANVGLLLYFKYANFFVAEFGALLGSVGLDSSGWEKVALPIGISFFTFQKISYVVDVAKGAAQPARSFWDCLLYVSLFPQLIAGPIVRYHDVDQQIRSRSHSVEQFSSGVQRFTVGLAKKVVLANAMAGIADPVFSVDVSAVPTSYAWLAAWAYTLQIYFDFSGYSDMAIGLGRMMGFEFLENFDRPYVARTFTEFWRRWHISLSRWMREYLYIPLGGNRVAIWKQYRNLWIVFLVSGFWHGASWNFIAWGAYQGVFLTADKLFLLRWAERIPDLLLRVGMVPLVMFSWVLFRADDLPTAWKFWGRMLTGGGPEVDGSYVQSQVWLDGRDVAMLVMASVLCVLPWSTVYRSAESGVLAWVRRSNAGALAAMVVTTLLCAYSLMVLVNSAHNPFIYFRF